MIRLSLLFVFAVFQIFGQNKVNDSLLHVLETAVHDSDKVNILNVLSEKNGRMGNYDTALYYARKAKALAEDEYPTANSNRKISIRYAISSALNKIGLISQKQGNFSEALQAYNEALLIRKELGDKNAVASSLNNMGTIHEILGNLPEALKHHFAALKMKEEIGNKRGVSISLNNIGIIYRRQGKYEDALKNYLKVLAIEKENDNPEGIAAALNNIGNLYKDQEKFDEALTNYLEVLKIEEELGDKGGIANTLNNLGVINQNQGNYTESLKKHFAALEIRKEIGDQSGITNSYNNIGKIYLEIGKPREGKELLLKALNLAKEIGYLETIKECYLGLSEAERLLGNFNQAYENYKQFIVYRDSLVNEEISNKIVQQQMQYEFEKKDALARAEQEKKDVLSRQEFDKQKMQRNGFIAGFGVMIVLAGMSYRSYRNKQKANLIITRQKEEVEIQKHLVEEKQKEILDSINYAKRIQAAVLPPDRLIKEHLPDSFILYKPKDIVAGDFYWLEYKNGILLLAAADCTGHGVPGAMVSVICNNGLNRSVREYGLTLPGSILDKTREIIIQEFEKSEEEVKDGMDISLCAFSFATLTLNWAGANNPLWIIRKNQGSVSELIDIKPDKQPIGKYAENKPFSNHSIQLLKGDTIYIFTDGLADQFGGETGKKFKTANLKKLLLSIQHESMSRQKELINESFEKWRGALDQIDDVCIIGVRV